MRKLMESLLLVRNVTHWAENKGTAKVVLVGVDIVKP